MAGIGVILNPYSKKYKKDPHKMKRMGFIVGDKASCKETEDFNDLRRVADEFKTRDIDILAISGGDGTNHCTLTTFINVYGDKPLPKICFLRGGTLNTVASTMGVQGHPEDILSRLLLKYHEDIPFKTRQVMMTKINDEYGFIFGMGVIYKFMEDYYGGSKDLSALAAARTLVKAIGSALINGPFAYQLFKRFDAAIEVNGHKWPYANYSALYTGSINQLGLNFRVYYLVDKHPDKFHAIGFSTPPRNILPYVPLMNLGKSSNFPNLIEEATSKMNIRLKAPMAYTIDGDMKPPCDNFEVSCGPNLTVLIP